MTFFVYSQLVLVFCKTKKLSFFPVLLKLFPSPSTAKPISPGTSFQGRLEIFCSCTKLLETCGTFIATRTGKVRKTDSDQTCDTLRYVCNVWA
jgi:hypothetical protein